MRGSAKRYNEGPRSIAFSWFVTPSLTMVLTMTTINHKYPSYVHQLNAFSKSRWSKVLLRHPWWTWRFCPTGHAHCACNLYDVMAGDLDLSATSVCFTDIRNSKSKISSAFDWSILSNPDGYVSDLNPRPSIDRFCLYHGFVVLRGTLFTLDIDWFPAKHASLFLLIGSDATWSCVGFEITVTQMRTIVLEYVPTVGP